METLPFPFDWETLEKGTYIEAEALERAIRRPRTDKDFKLKALAVVAEIKERTGILCRIEGDRLRLMTDSEAYQWNYQRARSHVTGLIRSAKNTALIDTSQLSDGDKRAAESCQIAICATASAARREQVKHAKLFGLVAPETVAEIGDGS